MKSGFSLKEDGFNQENRILVFREQCDKNNTDLS
jgi:hypothetical protein